MAGERDLPRQRHVAVFGAALVRIYVARWRCSWVQPSETPT